jgi:LAS superfamily LD-carboxypeptidase LdcB
MVPVPLSANKLAPDFAGTQYLYPVTGAEKNIVKIKMAGTRNSTATIQGDFELANIKAGFSGKTAPKFIDTSGNEIPFTWHHLDDFDPITGECTIQLVRSDAHTGVQGMTHSGSVSQYKVYNGSGY